MQSLASPIYAASSVRLEKQDAIYADKVWINLIGDGGGKISVLVDRAAMPGLEQAIQCFNDWLEFDHDNSGYQRLVAEEARRCAIFDQFSTDDVETLFNAMDWAARSAVEIGKRDEGTAVLGRKYGDMAIALRKVIEARDMKKGAA